jgi:acyl transferase domain-containing protein
LDRDGILSSPNTDSRLLAEDEDADALVANWIAKRKMNKLAEAWSAGVEIDWRQLYGVTKPRRLNLPAYPFARERYWIEPVDPRTRVAAPNALAENPSVTVEQDEGDNSTQGLLLAYPEWTGVPVAKSTRNRPFDERLVIAFGLPSPVADGLECRLPGITFFHLRTEMEEPEEGYEVISLQLFERLKQRLQEKPKTRT